MTWSAEDFGRWGDVFEIAVKTGVLYYLAGEHGVTCEKFAHLQEWQETRRGQIAEHLIREMELTDDNAIREVRDYCEHLFVQGFGLGFTTMRAYMQYMRSSTPFRPQAPMAEIEKLWCPLSLPSRKDLNDQERFEQKRGTLLHFWRAMGFLGPPDASWTRIGQPAQADFLMQWRCGKDVHLLCLEFSMQVIPQIPDFRGQDAHACELARYVKTIERRGVFSTITTELFEGSFHINDRILTHLSALTTGDKPLYKLCQGASYATQWMRALRQRQQAPDALKTRVMAVTNAGLESLYAPLGKEYESHPQAQLMEQLGRLYRERPLEAGTEESLYSEIRALFRQLSLALPEPIRCQMRALLDDPPVGHALSKRFTEPISDFINPVAPFSVQESLGWIAADDKIANILGTDAKAAIHQELIALKGLSCEWVTLRDIHNAAIRRFVKTALKGKLNVLALEGHPGLGKTYAISHALRELEEGFLFFYASPRIVINDTVTQDIANLYPDALTLTTNAVINHSASTWYQAHKNHYPHAVQHVKGAVICQMPPGFSPPLSDILYLCSQDQAEIDEGLGSSSFRAQQVDETMRLIEQPRRAGVMQTLAQACREALSHAPALKKVAMTGAIQGYRIPKNGEKTTLSTFWGHFFRHSPGNEKALRERQALARRIPNMVIMIDELAGDSAGPLFAHDFASQLVKQLIEPFAEEPAGSPFRVLFVLADASLGNASVMESFLASEPTSPPKILVSQGYPGSPFRLEVRPLRLGTRRELVVDVLHVMADAFPASTLSIDYALHLTPVRIESKEQDRKEARHIVRDQTQDAFQRSLMDEILRALARTPPGEQVIFFLQDKGMLRDLESLFREPTQADVLGLTEAFPANWSAEQVAKLDGSIPPWERQSLLQPEIRDQKRLFLMTSSGARGVSFPLATTIIAHVPGFSIESGLMEIVQLIFRGRGGQGDQLPRRLVMLIHDFVFPEQEDRQHDPRGWARRMIDLVTILVLLRGTILTRIIGHAGLHQQNMSIVPVGHVRVDESVQTMSQSLHEFIREAQLCLKTESAERAAPAARALDETQALFTNSRWESVHPQGNSVLSIAQPERLRVFLSRISSLTRVLVSFDEPVCLPPHLYSNGILWFEDWSRDRLYEDFHFELWQNIMRHRTGSLLKALRYIDYSKNRMPPRLRRAARDLLIVLDRSLEQSSTLQKSRMQIQVSNVWTVTPVDYTRFYPTTAENAQRENRWQLQHHEHWHNFLLRASCASPSPPAFHPVIPQYKDFPYVGVVLYDEPLGLKRVMDDRYFMASREFNILSSLLFRG